MDWPLALMTISCKWSVPPCLPTFGAHNLLPGNDTFPGPFPFPLSFSSWLCRPRLLSILFIFISRCSPSFIIVLMTLLLDDLITPLLPLERHWSLSFFIVTEPKTRCTWRFFLSGKYQDGDAEGNRPDTWPTSTNKNEFSTTVSSQKTVVVPKS